MSDTTADGTEANRFIKVDCEWDIGVDNLIFRSKKEAKVWLENNEHLKEILEDCTDSETGEKSTINDLFKEGLIDYVKLVVYDPNEVKG